VFPAALDPAQEDVVVTHPGLTYGGIVHAGFLRGPTILEVLRAIAKVYREAGLSYLRYKATPHIYHKVPSTDDLYALFRLKAVRYRCDLSAAIDLTSHWRLSKGRRSDLSKARRFGVQVELGARYLEPFWAILEENLASKYETRPTHTLAEIARLQSMFPEQIECVVGRIEDEEVAGVVLFRTSRVVHLQYAATTPKGNALGAQTAVMSHAIDRSQDWEARFFDFGMSNEREGQVLNEGLCRFKMSFGAGGVVYEFYELDLKRSS
jgi:hypothetical protein